jgi:hypothetical protein
VNKRKPDCGTERNQSRDEDAGHKHKRVRAEQDKSVSPKSLKEGGHQREDGTKSQGGTTQGHAPDCAKGRLVSGSKHKLGGGYAKNSSTRSPTKPQGGAGKERSPSSFGQEPEEVLESHGRTSKVPGRPGLQQGPIFQEGWLRRKERLAGMVSCREGCGQEDESEWRQKAHGGAFCTSCKFALMNELAVNWDKREELHDRIPCTRTKEDGQEDYSRSEAQNALSGVRRI